MDLLSFINYLIFLWLFLRREVLTHFFLVTTSQVMRCVTAREMVQFCQANTPDRRNLIGVWCLRKFPNWAMWPLLIPMPQAKRLLTKEYTQGCEGLGGWFLAFVLPKTDAGGIEQRCIERQRLLSWLRSFQKKPKLSLRYAGFTLLTFVQWDGRKRTKSRTS